MKKDNNIELWFVYLVQCADNTYYCGICKNIENRLAVHNSGKGAKYTRGRIPLHLLDSIGPFDKSIALAIEKRIKRVSRKKKLDFLRSLKP